MNFLELFDFVFDLILKILMFKKNNVYYLLLLETLNYDNHHLVNWITCFKCVHYPGVPFDWETGDIVARLFGKQGHVYRKFRRSMYWLRKFRHRNPYQVPFELPLDPIELARLALQKMAVDYENEIQVWKVWMYYKNNNLLIWSYLFFFGVGFFM